MAWYNAWRNSSDGKTPEQLQAESDAADQALAELNRERLERGKWNQTQFETAEQHRVAGAVNVDAQIDSEFNKGLREGYENVTSGVKAVVNAPLKFAWDALPFWVWPAALFAVFLYLGGGNVIRGFIAKKGAA